MAEPALRRKSFFINEGALRRARKALGASTDAEAIRTALERVAEMEEFWAFMERSRRTLGEGSFEAT